MAGSLRPFSFQVSHPHPSQTGWAHPTAGWDSKIPDSPRERKGLGPSSRDPISAGWLSWLGRAAFSFPHSNVLRSPDGWDLFLLQQGLQHHVNGPGGYPFIPEIIDGWILIINDQV